MAMATPPSGLWPRLSTVLGTPPASLTRSWSPNERSTGRGKTGGTGAHGSFNGPQGGDSRRRSRYALLARVQGRAEGDAAARRQADDPVRGGGRGRRRDRRDHLRDGAEEDGDPGSLR